MKTRKKMKILLLQGHTKPTIDYFKSVKVEKMVKKNGQLIMKYRDF